MKNRIMIILACFLVLSPVLWPHNFGVGKTNAMEEALPAVGSMANLKALLKKENYFNGYDLREFTVTESADAPAMAGERGELNQKASASSEEFSTTNVQVAGVDEADIVKTDGSYIYQVNNSSILVLDVRNPQKMTIASKIDFDQEYYYPQEMFLSDQYLTLIGFSSAPIRLPSPIIYDSIQSTTKPNILPELMPRYPHFSSTVSVKVFDIGVKEKIREVREICLEGSYVSSRMIEDNLYLMANRMIDYYGITERGDEAQPYYKDSYLGEQPQSIGFEDIRYFPDAIAPNYITLLGLNLKDMDKKANINTYLGQGNNIYSSTENLFVAVDRYETENNISNESVIGSTIRGIPRNTRYTEVYKFALEGGITIYKAKGKVPGNILNQFAMDENNGFFRIATTTGEMWRTDENTSKNNVYILDDKMELAGKLEGIAPTERIYAMRFMGDKGYMVTFRQTDPFFVIDLKDPKEPKVLGYLKIPGYSDYLHPYDENHVIGFGKEVIMEKGMALQTGMKVAVFDVSNVNVPIEKFKIEIGSRGTDSPLLRDHKALLFSKDKQLLAFPVTVMESRNKTEWGQFVFQGAYVYELNMDKGLNLVNKITHLSKDDYTMAGSHWYDSDKNVNRIIYIGESLYTLSHGRIEAHGLNDMKLKGYLLLK